MSRSCKDEEVLALTCSLARWACSRISALRASSLPQGLGSRAGCKRRLPEPGAGLRIARFTPAVAALLLLSVPAIGEPKAPPASAPASPGPKQVAKDIGKTVKDAGKDVGKATKKIGREVGPKAKKAGKEIGEAGKEVGKRIKEAGKEIVQ